MYWYSIGFLIGSIFTFILGVFVFLRDRKNFLNKIWCLQCFSVSVWQFGRSMMGISVDEDAGRLWNRILYFGAIFIPVLTFHFVLALIGKSKEKKNQLLIAYGLIFFELIGFNFSKLFVKDVVFNPQIGFYEVPGIIYFIHFLMLGYPTYSVWLLFKEHQKTSNALKKNQIRYVIAASLVGFISGATSFLPFLKVDIPPFAAPFTSLYIFIISYAIVEYRLMDITVVIKKSITYSILIFLLLTPSLLILFLSEKTVFKTFDYTFSLILVLLSFLVAFAFPRLKVILERRIREVLFKDEIVHENIFSKLSTSIVQVLDLDALLNQIVDLIVKTLNLEKVSILVLDNEDKTYKVAASFGLNGKGSNLLFSGHDYFFRWLVEKNDLVIREEVEEKIYSDHRMSLVCEMMKKMASEVTFPLIHQERLIGIINLGLKKKKLLYTHKDFEMLKTLASQASIAIGNARLYEMLKKSNIHMRRADRLASLGTLTAGLAHEIRNPLVSIKTFLQLLPERFDDEEFRTSFLNLTIEEVDRICKLLSELLSFARPSEPIFQEADINEILERVVLFAETEISKKSLVVHKKYCPDLQPLMLDKEQMKQVFLNIFLNAVQASNEGGEIFLETRFITGDEKLVQIIIRDTGVGISEKNLEDIFTPFFTTKDEGSGLGLSISHQIVQEHNGTINVKSQLGEGSTFIINLPLNPTNDKTKKNLFSITERTTG